MFTSIESYNNIKDEWLQLSLPIPTIIFDTTYLNNDDVLPTNVQTFSSFITTNTTTTTTTSSSNVGIATILGLTVAYINKNANTNDDDYNNVIEIVSSSSYRGCDLLISSDWPAELHHFIPDDEYNNLKGLGIGLGIGSSSIATFATKARPRYHFASGRNAFFQRSPYRNECSSNGTPSPCTRFIGLGIVSDSKEKDKRWMHALSLEPIVYMNIAEIAECPPGTTDRPYVEVGKVIGDMPAAKKFKTDTGANVVVAGALFFGNKGLTRDGKTMQGSINSAPNLIAPSKTARQLFIGGLLRDTSVSDIKRIFPNSTNITKIEGKTYAFVEFENHVVANKVVEASLRKAFDLNGRSLTVGWTSKEVDSATQRYASNVPGFISGARNPTANASKDVLTLHRDLNSPSTESKKLFIGGLPISDKAADNNDVVTTIKNMFSGVIDVITVQGRNFSFVEFESFDMAKAVVDKSVKDTINYINGQPLTIGWATREIDDVDDNNKKRRYLELNQPTPLTKTLYIGGLALSVTDKEIEGLFAAKTVEFVRRPDGKDFAFIEFITPDGAIEAMEKAASTPMLLQGQDIEMGWARGKSADKPVASSSHSADCWFCLASPSIKLHLIASVSDLAYVALPRGGIVDFHCLLIPVDCVPSRIHLSAAAKQEFLKYEAAIEEMFEEQNSVSLRFERAIRTQGRDHMQVQMIPIPINKISQGVSVFSQLSKSAQLYFHDVSDSSQDIDEIVLSMEGGPYQEYFYISIPIGDTKGKHRASRRFVYVHEENSKRFPFQFGNDVAAQILGCLERSNWKVMIIHILITTQSHNHIILTITIQLLELCTI